MDKLSAPDDEGGGTGAAGGSADSTGLLVQSTQPAVRPVTNRRYYWACWKVPVLKMAHSTPRF